jgi:acyl-CoA hydrolase/GNAT superfamily N-acetyltransferase
MSDNLKKLEKSYPEKFVSEEQAFEHIRRGARIFIGTGCGEPQHLVSGLINYVESHPDAFSDAEVIQVWTLGLAPYINNKFKKNFRHNSFFIGDITRYAVNTGMADYTPIFLSQVPDLFRRGLVPIDVALIQTSPPDEHDYFSLGVSVDIVKAAVQSARIVIAQINSNMPYVHGDSFVHIEDIDYIIPYDEPLLKYYFEADDNISNRIGKNVSRLIHDGDTIQVGYGSIPNAVLTNLYDKKHLGVHTELLSDGLIDLMEKGVVDNTRKNIDQGKTVATFCMSMGKDETYRYIHDNPEIEFRPVDHTNNLLVIAQHDNMTAINSALEIDLTGQATAESLGKMFYSGIGGQADFMRGAVLASHGKSILTIPSTANENKISKIVPFLKEGVGVTLNRGDVHYVVTEYGIVYLHGKNIRERAMELISIAHPKFRSWLIEEAKNQNLIYKDQAFIPGKEGEYPEYLETYRTTKTGMEILLRPVKISDEPLLKEFFYSLSDKSIYRRFISKRTDMPHRLLQTFVVIDYTKNMAILAVIKQDEKEKVIGIGQYFVDEAAHTAEVAFAVADNFQNNGIGKELVSYITYLGRKRGLLGLTSEVLKDNSPMIHIFKKLDFKLEMENYERVYEMKIIFE